MLDNKEENLQIIQRGTSEIIDHDELIGKLKTQRSLIIKAGFDPTAPDLHLGHCVLLRKLKQFQDMGHQIYIIIGDFTATIGDPTGKNKLRQRLSFKEVSENAKTYQSQVFKILDEKKTKILFNSRWLNKLSFHQVLDLTSSYTIARMLEREDFSKRYKNNLPISITEFIYPLIQGYDSLEIKSDIELGGTDQKFNLLVGRELMRQKDISPQVIITMPILPGLDGIKKMSKSLDNYVALNDSPQNIFGKIMSIPDTLINDYFLLLTDISEKNIHLYNEKIKKGENPRNIKMILAQTIVDQYHKSGSGKQAKEEFINIFSNKQTPDKMPEIKSNQTSIKTLDLVVLTKHTQSNSEARRLIKQGSVKINNEKITNEYQIIPLQNKDVLKIGKRGFYLIRI